MILYKCIIYLHVYIYIFSHICWVYWYCDAQSYPRDCLHTLGKLYNPPASTVPTKPHTSSIISPAANARADWSHPAPHQRWAQTPCHSVTTLVTPRPTANASRLQRPTPYAAVRANAAELQRWSSQPTGAAAWVPCNRFHQCLDSSQSREENEGARPSVSDRYLWSRHCLTSPYWVLGTEAGAVLGARTPTSICQQHAHK